MHFRIHFYYNYFQKGEGFLTGGLLLPPYVPKSMNRVCVSQAVTPQYDTYQVVTSPQNYYMPGLYNYSSHHCIFNNTIKDVITNLC